MTDEQKREIFNDMVYDILVNDDVDNTLLALDKGAYGDVVEGGDTFVLSQKELAYGLAKLASDYIANLVKGVTF